MFSILKELFSKTQFINYTFNIYIPDSQHYPKLLSEHRLTRFPAFLFKNWSCSIVVSLPSGLTNSCNIESDWLIENEIDRNNFL